MNTTKSGTLINVQYTGTCVQATEAGPRLCPLHEAADDAVRLLARIASLMESGDLPGKDWIEYTQITQCLHRVGA